MSEKWQAAKISGRFNQLDAAGNLIIWSVKSPKELFALVAGAMGFDLSPESEFPEGLTFTEAANGRKPYGSNPPVVFEALPAAKAMAKLCDLFGRRTTIRVIDRMVDVGPFAPLTLEAVGQDYDGKIKPLAQLNWVPEYSKRVRAEKVEEALAGAIKKNFAYRAESLLESKIRAALEDMGKFVPNAQWTPAAMAKELASRLGKTTRVLEQTVSAGEVEVHCGKLEITTNRPAHVPPGQPVISSDLEIRIDGQRVDPSYFRLEAQSKGLLRVNMTLPVEFGEEPKRL